MVTGMMRLRHAIVGPSIASAYGSVSKSIWYAVRAELEMKEKIDALPVRGRYNLRATKKTNPL
jgi:hypothetical protein